jgi:hypothetical protein
MKTTDGRTGERRRLLLAGLLIFLLSAAVRLPLLTAPSRKTTSDAVEYVNIARHLAEGEGLRISIKWHMLEARPVVRSAVGDRYFLYPLATASGLRLFPRSDALLIARSVNLVFSSLTAALSLFLFAGLFGWRVGGLAALLVALNAGMVRSGVDPLSDSLFLLLGLIALLLYSAREREPPPGKWRAGAIGAVCALAQFTRPVGVVLLAALVMGFLVRKRGREAGWALLGFLVVMSPYFWANWKQNGSPFYSATAYNYTVEHSREGTWFGLDREPLSSWQFITSNRGRVGELVKRKFAVNGHMLVSQLGALLLFAVFLSKGALRGSRGALLGYAGLNFLFYSLSWAPAEARRYLLPSYLLPIPFLLESAARPRWARLQRAGPYLLAAAFLMGAGNFLCQDIALYSQMLTPARQTQFTRAYQQAALWLERETAPGEIVASNNPWEINYRSRRPAVICPVFSKEEQMGAFLRAHDVSIIILFATPQDARARMLATAAGRREARLISPAAAEGLPLLIYRAKEKGN